MPIFPSLYPLNPCVLSGTIKVANIRADYQKSRPSRADSKGPSALSAQSFLIAPIFLIASSFLSAPNFLIVSIFLTAPNFLTVSSFSNVFSFSSASSFLSVLNICNFLLFALLIRTLQIFRTIYFLKIIRDFEK
jgi:hypothetical protein